MESLGKIIENPEFHLGSRKLHFKNVSVEITVTVSVSGAEGGDGGIVIYDILVDITEEEITLLETDELVALVIHNPRFFNQESLNSMKAEVKRRKNDERSNTSFEMGGVENGLNDSLGRPLSGKKPKIGSQEIDICQGAGFEVFAKEEAERKALEKQCLNKVVTITRSNGESANGVVESAATSNELWVKYLDENNTPKKNKFTLQALGMLNQEFRKNLPSSQEVLASSQDPSLQLLLEMSAKNFETVKEDKNENVPRAKDNNGFDIYQKHEFHYFEDTKGKRSVIIILKNGECYSFGQSGPAFICRGCNSTARGHTRKWTKLIINNDETISADPSHTCLPRDYNTEIGSIAIGNQLGGKALNEEAGKKRHSKGEYELHHYVVDGVKKNKLIIFDAVDHALCYEFFCDAYSRYYCLGCCEGGRLNQKRQRRLLATIEQFNGQECVYTTENHLCTLREYDTVMKGVKDVRKIIIKAPSFEIIHYTQNNILSKKMVIFIESPNDDESENEKEKRKCYIYRHESGHYYCCGCAVVGTTTRADVKENNGEVEVIATAVHQCVEREYGKEMKKWSDEIVVKDGEYEIITSKNGVPNLVVYSDASKNKGYILTRKRNGYACYPCQAKFKSTYGRIIEQSKDLRMFGQHICFPIILHPPNQKVNGKFLMLKEWLGNNEGIQELEWLKGDQRLHHLRGTDAVMTTHYALSTAPPTAAPMQILSLMFYLGFSTNHLNRAFAHGATWEEIFEHYEQIWMYPILIDISSLTREMEAIGIALYQSGSLDLPLENKQRGAFSRYDAENNAYVMESIAADADHPKHKELAAAYKRYLMNAVSDKRMKTMAVNIKEVAKINKLPFTKPIAFW